MRGRGHSKLSGRGRASLRLRIFCSSKCGSPASVGARETSSGEAQVSIDNLVEESDSGEEDASDDGESCPSIVDTKKLKHLLANDPTLSRIREQAERDREIVSGRMAYCIASGTPRKARE